MASLPEEGLRNQGQFGSLNLASPTSAAHQSPYGRTMRTPYGRTMRTPYGRKTGGETCELGIKSPDLGNKSTHHRSIKPKSINNQLNTKIYLWSWINKPVLEKVNSPPENSLF